MCIDWNAVSAIATAFASGIALYASFQARSESKYALKMQEQSRSLELVDKRIELAEKIRLDKSVPEWTVRVLFDNDIDIVEHYAAWKKHLAEAEQVEIEITGLSVNFKYDTEAAIRNHPELRDRKTEAERNAVNEKQMTLQLVEEFISDSIKSLDKRPKRKLSKRKKGDS